MSILEEYQKLLKKQKLDVRIQKYLSVPSLVRLKKIGYFCGMDYGSKDIYSFLEYVSRYDHSYSTMLLTSWFSDDLAVLLAALFHDVSTPCTSHVVDYLNKDYEKQESTETKTEEVLKRDALFLSYLKEDNLLLEDIVDFKKYSFLDLERPKLCADRLDGIFLTSLFWTKEMNLEEVKMALNWITAFRNEDNELEIGFTNLEVGQMILQKNEKIDLFCHTNEDNYMMEYLASILRKCLEKKLFTYTMLYQMTEEEMIWKMIKDEEIKGMWQTFQEIKKEEIPYISLPNVKKRVMKPLINGVRM